MDRERVENAIRAALAEKHLSDAAPLAVETYGPEVLAFIEDRISNLGDAQDVFADFLEAL